MTAPKTEDEAVRRFTPFVAKTAMRFVGNGVAFDDLVQEGLVAVALAFRLWDPQGGASMRTWIRRPVRNAMSKYVRTAVASGIGRRAQGSRSGFERLGKGARIRHVSMDAPFGEGEQNEAGCLHDTLGTFEEPRDVLALRQLPSALARLTPQERNVIRLRFERGFTLEEVGERLGFSRERARQIEADALRTLRERVKGDPDVAVH